MHLGRKPDHALGPAAESRDVVGDGLTALGAIVDECIAYRTVPETADPTGAKARLAAQGADLITFTSGSTRSSTTSSPSAWIGRTVVLRAASAR
jgi:uroporphyrinogen-III synthase